MKKTTIKILGAFLIVIGILLITLILIPISKNKQHEYDSVAIADSYMLISIPKIKLKANIYDINDSMNDVDKGIELLTSDTPDMDNSKVVLASHSGNSKISYFKKLNKIKKGTNIYIKYDGVVYKYKLAKKYSIKKNGTAKIVTKKNKRSLALITCDKKNKKKQIVFIAYQESVVEEGDIYF